MDLFTAHRQIRNVAVTFPFPENIVPFPEIADTLFDDRTAEIHLPEIEHHSQLPPQKLRPIRCNGRSLPEFPDLVEPENVGLDGALLSCHGAGSPELGFLSQLSTQKLSAVIGGHGECGETIVGIGSGAFPENGVAGDPFPAVDVGVAAAEQIKLEMNAECMKLLSQGRLLEAELSSSSDDDGESSEATTEPLNRKRKRNRRKKLELFMENMMRKVIEKQEHMHRQLIEMIEQKERERIIREEAWKQLEIERAKRDEEVRAQETYRSLALISFIQNLLGHEIQIPKSLEPSYPRKDEVVTEIHDQKYFKCDPSNRRWPKSEVQALITVRTALDHKFLKGPKSCVWEEVAIGLSNMGYNRSAKKCKEKWENINKYYKRTIESGKNRPAWAKACPYFHELDLLYKSRFVNVGNASNHISNETEDKSVK